MTYSKQKISEYTAYTAPLASTDIFDVTQDPVGTPVTRSITKAQLATELGLAILTGTSTYTTRFDVSGDLVESSALTNDGTDITVASILYAPNRVANSATTNTVLSDSSSTANIQFDVDALDDVGISGGTPWGTDPFIYVSNRDCAFGLGDSDGDITFYADSGGATSFFRLYLRNTTNDAIIFEAVDNRAANKTTANTSDSFGAAFGGRNVTFVSTIENAVSTGGDTLTVDTPETAHAANRNTKIDALGAVTGTIDLDTAGNGITAGAYKTVAATGNITLNATTAYSTSNSAMWHLEHTQNDGGSGVTTVTLGTNFIGTATTNTGAGAITIFQFVTRSDGKHVLMNTI